MPGVGLDGAGVGEGAIDDERRRAVPAVLRMVPAFIDRCFTPAELSMPALDSIR